MATSLATRCKTPQQPDATKKKEVTNKANTPGTSHLQLPCALLLVTNKPTNIFSTSSNIFACCCSNHLNIHQSNDCCWRHNVVTFRCLSDRPLQSATSESVQIQVTCIRQQQNSQKSHVNAAVWCEHWRRNAETQQKRFQLRQVRSLHSPQCKQRLCCSVCPLDSGRIAGILYFARWPLVFVCGRCRLHFVWTLSCSCERRVNKSFCCCSLWNWLQFNWISNWFVWKHMCCFSHDSDLFLQQMVTRTMFTRDSSLAMFTRGWRSTISIETLIAAAAMRKELLGSVHRHD